MAGVKAGRVHLCRVAGGTVCAKCEAVSKSCVGCWATLRYVTLRHVTSLGARIVRRAVSWRLTACSATPARPPTNTSRLSTSAGKVRVIFAHL